MLSLSIAIITHNESSRLGKTLASVASISRDIVVVDSGSTDNTVAIAESFGARVIRKEFTTYSEQRNYALSQCIEPWVLYLNAGDFVSVELRTRLQSIVTGTDCDYVGNPINATNDGDATATNDGDAGDAVYSILVQSLWHGRVVRYGSLRPRYVPRLFHRGSADLGIGFEAGDETAVVGRFDEGSFDGRFVALPSVPEYRVREVLRNHVAVRVNDYVSRMNRHTHVLAAYMHSMGEHNPARLNKFRERKGSGKPDKVALFVSERYLQVVNIVRFVYVFLLSYIVRGNALNLTTGVTVSLAHALVPAIARAKTRRRYGDYASMYDYPANVVENDTPEDRAYDENGRLMVRRILVARTDMIGDMITCTPAINMLRRMFPDARLDVLGSVYNVDIVKPLPAVDNIYAHGSMSGALPDNEDTSRDEALLKTLNANKYDVLIASYMGNASVKFTSRLTIPYKVAAERSSALPHGLPINYRHASNNFHEVDYTLLLVRHIDPKLYDATIAATTTAELECDKVVHYSEDDALAVKDFLAKHNLTPCYCKPHRFQPNHGDGFVSGSSSRATGAANPQGDEGVQGEAGFCNPLQGGFVAMNIYGSGARIYPSLLTYRNMAKQLTSMGYRVVVIAIPYGIRKYNDAIAQKYFGDIEGVCVFGDATSVLRTAALVDAAIAYIGISTGPTHMANASGVPSVLTYVNDDNEIRNWFPRNSHNIATLMPSWERVKSDYIAYSNAMATDTAKYMDTLMRGLYHVDDADTSDTSDVTVDGDAVLRGGE